MLAELGFSWRWLRSCRDVRSESTCLHVLLFAMGDPEPPLGDPALAAGDTEVALGDPELAAGEPEIDLRDAELAIGDPECVDELLAALVVPGAAVPPALLPVPELHAARIRVAPAISTAAAVLVGPTGPTGLTCLTDLTCDCLIMRLWSPPDGTSTSPAAGEIAADTAGRRAVHSRRLYRSGDIWKIRKIA